MKFFLLPLLLVSSICAHANVQVSCHQSANPQNSVYFFHHQGTTGPIQITYKNMIYLLKNQNVFSGLVKGGDDEGVITVFGPQNTDRHTLNNAVLVQYHSSGALVWKSKDLGDVRFDICE